MLQRSGIKRMRTQFATISDAAILLKALMKGRHLAVLPRLPLRLLRDTFPLVEIIPPAGTIRRALYIWSRSELAEEPSMQALQQSLKTMVNEWSTFNVGSEPMRSQPPR